MIELFLLGSQRERFSGGVVITADDIKVSEAETKLKLKHQVTIDKCPYKPAGRYVCDAAVEEAHLFDNLEEATAFAEAWGRDCNIGWLTKEHRGSGCFEYPREHEAQVQISKKVKVFDHRKNFKPK